MNTNAAPIQPTKEPYSGEKGRRMADFTNEYQDYLMGYINADLLEVPNRLLNLLRSTEYLQHGHEVTQLTHMLQTATRAERAGATPDIIMAALFHDVGKAVSNSNHPAMSAEMVRPWLSEDAYWLIKNHQDFQGIHYFARMGLDPNMRIKHKDHPCYALAEQFVDEWDQEAFDPDYDTFPLEHFEDLVRTTFSRAPRRPVT
ncbi:MAG: HD domain-containing protein [Ilumatobacteraceae bacterium]